MCSFSSKAQRVHLSPSPLVPQWGYEFNVRGLNIVSASVSDSQNQACSVYVLTELENCKPYLQLLPLTYCPFSLI